jgi:hypothetical protein
MEESSRQDPADTIQQQPHSFVLTTLLATFVVFGLITVKICFVDRACEPGVFWP